MLDKFSKAWKSIKDFFGMLKIIVTFIKENKDLFQMIKKYKELWISIISKGNDIKNIMKSIPKSDPNVDVKWEEGQPVFKKKNEKK